MYSEWRHTSRYDKYVENTLTKTINILALNLNGKQTWAIFQITLIT